MTRRWSKIALLFRDKSLISKNFKDLMNVFKALDDEKNGIIDFKKFKAGLLNVKDLKLIDIDIDEQFKGMETNKIVTIGYESLVKALTYDYFVMTDCRLYKAFRNLDENESGNIQTDVLRKKIFELNVYRKPDKVIEIIDDANLDSDGIIDYEEFLRELQSDLNQTPKCF